MYSRYISKQGAEATARAAQIVLDSLPQLTTLTIGGQQVNITRSKDGNPSAILPWTGRMTEWLREVVKPLDAEFDTDYDAEYGEM